MIILQHGLIDNKTVSKQYQSLIKVVKRFRFRRPLCSCCLSVKLSLVSLIYFLFRFTELSVISYFLSLCSFNSYFVGHYVTSLRFRYVQFSKSNFTFRRSVLSQFRVHGVLFTCIINIMHVNYKVTPVASVFLYVFWLATVLKGRIIFRTDEVGTLETCTFDTSS